MANNPFEIPQTLRGLSEQNLKQAQTAYEQLTGFVTKATDAWIDSMPANSITAGFKDVHGRVMGFAMDNAEFGFCVRGQDLQRIDPPGGLDDSDAVCTRADASLRHADAAPF